VVSSLHEPFCAVLGMECFSKDAVIIVNGLLLKGVEPIVSRYSELEGEIDVR